MGGAGLRASNPGLAAEPVGMALEFPPALFGSLGAGTEKMDGWLYLGSGIGKIDVAENQGVWRSEDLESSLS